MIVSQRRIEAVVFDLDDTLIDWSEPSVTRQEFYRPRICRVRGFLSGEGHKLPPPEEFFTIVDQAMIATWAEARKSWLIPSIGEMLCQVFQDLGLDVSQIDVNRILRIFSWEPRPGVELFPDSIPVLKELQRQGYRIGLLTNSFLPMWMRDQELESYGLMGFLDVRVSSGDIGYIKPHPAIFRYLLEMLGATADRVVFVGDRPKNDIAGANAAGLISVLLDPPHLDRELDGVEPKFTITSLSELLPILANLEGEMGTSGQEDIY